jgi:hypothetical protein
MQEMVMKLDELGKPAWIALMVVSFILFWPIGLAVLAFLLWSGRMGCGSARNRSRWQQRMADRWDRGASAWSGGGRRDGGFSASGNRAFDEYREETLKRLEEEQHQFREFLERLRMAKDRAEFDQFMTERRSRPTTPPEGEATPGTA